MPRLELGEIFEKQTDMYRKRVDKNTFDLRYRKQLLGSAHGKVLEVAVGAGTNFQFYSPDVEVTAVDFTSTLLDIAEEIAEKHNIKAKFMTMDVEKLEFEDNSFDTIVSTWSFCAYKDPIQVLKKFNRWCKPNGQILLFEHGLNGNTLIDWVLNRIDGLTLGKIGCHANSDIRKLVNDSNLVIDKIQKVSMIFYLVWARPNKGG